MQLYEFTSITSDDKKRVVHVAGRVADHRDPEEQKEWITFQLVTDEPTTQTDASLRAAALSKVREKLHELARDFGQIGDQWR